MRPNKLKSGTEEIWAEKKFSEGMLRANRHPFISESDVYSRGDYCGK
ncbi:MAG TPA: hypothetical protein VD837_15960 [Terriglobales bacterium]|nr:hypothetical protein [Terriglobales bacterium]